MSEFDPHTTRLRRLRMRAWRRGIREMDLILGPFADRNLASLSSEELDVFEELLVENDQDLYAWIAGRTPPPEPFGDLIRRLRAEYGRPVD